MTEYSYFWFDSATGHGSLQPYSSDVMDSIADLMSAHENKSQGVIQGYLNELEYSNPWSVTARIASGAAIVAGSLYVNTENIDTHVGDNGYYVFILRKDWATQTVRFAYLYNSGAYPGVTQVWGTTWEIELFRIYKNAGYIVTPVEDKRRFVRNEYGEIRLIGRSGINTDKDWDYIYPGAYNILIATRQKGRAQAGCINWTGGAATSGSVSQNFAVPFSNDPIVIVTPLNSHGNVNISLEASETAITIYWKSGDATTYTTLDFQYFAVGPIERGY